MPAEAIVSNSTPVCFVGGAPIAKSDLLAVKTLVGAYIAVDSGADHLCDTDIQPRAVIGDLDSLSENARATFAGQLWHIAEQSTTDFEKALLRVDAPVVIALGFTGGRLDHSLSVLSVMLHHKTRPVILADADDVSFLALEGITGFALPKGTRISVMPLVHATVTLAGVGWPFKDQVMAPDGFTSPSNTANGGDIMLTTDAPVLVTLPRAFLPTALTAVVRAG